MGKLSLQNLPSVHLRPLEVGDAGRLFEGLSNRSIYTFLEQDPPKSPELLEERYRFLVAGAPANIGETWLNWVVEDPNSGQAFGTAQATIRDSSRPASIAYVLLPEWWGRGIASAAVTQLLDVLAEQFEVAEARAEIHERNVRSIQVVERLGFVHVDTVQENGYVDLIYVRTTQMLNTL